jgi:hypothetical protein
LPLTAALNTCPQAPSPQCDPERPQTLVADLLAQRQLINYATHRFAKGWGPLATDGTAGAVVSEHRMHPHAPCPKGLGPSALKLPTSLRDQSQFLPPY